MPAQVVDVLAQGLKQLFDAPVDIVGFSFGGVCAAHVAARRPELVRRLILVGHAGGLDTPLGDIRADQDARPGRRGEAGGDEGQISSVLMLHEPDSVDDLALYMQTVNVPRGRG